MTSPRSAVDLLRSLPASTRVTVRWALPSDDASGKKFTDSIGTIASTQRTDVLVLETRRGTVEIPWSAIRLAKPVPPPPSRRASQAP